MFSLCNFVSNSITRLPLAASSSAEFAFFTEENQLIQIFNCIQGEQTSTVSNLHFTKLDTDGYKAHYKCTGCGNLFSDAKGARQVTLQQVTTDKASHKFTDGLCGVSEIVAISSNPFGTTGDVTYPVLLKKPGKRACQTGTGVTASLYTASLT